MQKRLTTVRELGCMHYVLQQGLFNESAIWNSDSEKKKEGGSYFGVNHFVLALTRRHIAMYFHHRSQEGYYWAALVCRDLVDRVS